MTATSVTHVFMATAGPPESTAARPNPGRAPSSTADNSKDDPRRPMKKAHTFADTNSLEPLAKMQSSESSRGPDAFETSAGDNDDDSDGADMIRGSIDLGDLPIELVSLTDR